MNIPEELGSIQDGFEDALDRILGTRKAVCPVCGKVEHLIKETNVLCPHVYIPVEQTDFSNGIDFDQIKNCPGSGRTVQII